MIDQEYERPKHIPPDGGWKNREVYIIEYILSSLPGHEVDDPQHEYVHTSLAAYFGDGDNPYFYMINNLGKPLRVYLARMYFVRCLCTIGHERDIFSTHRLTSPEDYIYMVIKNVNKEKPSDYSHIRKIQCEAENG